jgi:trafficking protein particle complex subunit 1
MIHCLYIFSKAGSCLFYKEWNRPRNTLADNPDEERKLMFGLLFSLKQLMNKMAPAPL